MSTSVEASPLNATEPNAVVNDLAEPKTNVLLKFRHGLGDAVQLTAVLRHLRHYHPNWQIDVAALPGKHTAFIGLCNKRFVLGEHAMDETSYGRVVDLAWEECATCFPDWPSTKVERCMIEVFDLTPIPEFCGYEIHIRDEVFAKVKRYLRQVCRVDAGDDGRFPVVLLHYQGNTSAEYKNLSHDVARQVCDRVIRAGFVPVILDWDNRSPLPDGKRIHNPHVDLDIWGGIGTGDAEVLAALIQLSALMIGVDSGPLHVAGATATPTLAVWTKHHPLHYFGLANNVTHLVPESHQELLRGDRAIGAKYFEANYKFRTYQQVATELLNKVGEQLSDSDGGLVYTRNFWIRSNNADQDLVVVQDIAENDSYRIDELPMPEPVIVDVGAHIGCFSKAIHARNPLARIFAIECCPENIAALRKNAGGFATVVQGAMTYEEDVALLNAVFPDCVTTGGSCVVTCDTLNKSKRNAGVGDGPKDNDTQQYWADSRPLATITLEQLLDRYNINHIDVLKLDCEGSEFSILENSTSLERVDRIVGEYHGKDRFYDLVQRKFADWKLRILKDGELGTFWLERPRRDHVVRAATPRASRKQCGRDCSRQSAAPWIYLCTPLHTGTHFLRVLLELHPRVSFWKCGRTVVDGRTMNDWHRLCKDGLISFRELIRLGTRCNSDLPAWTEREVAKLGLRIPDKQVEFDLIHSHALATTHWYPSLPTVISVRDPLLAIISGLRRNGSDGAESIFSGVQFLAKRRSECFMFCVDLWKHHRERTLELFSYLGLEPTQEIYDYVAKWPSPNAIEDHKHLLQDKSSDLAEARHLALHEGKVHSCVSVWADRLRRAGLQEFYESLGYRDLAWFE